MSHSIVLFYKYVTITDPHRLMERERAVCEVLGLKGRVIIADEGINATLGGDSEAIQRYVAHMKKDRRFTDVDFKITDSTPDAFPRLSIKVRPEIVTSHLGADIDPRISSGTYLEPTELKRWFDAGKDFTIIDMRNDYEYAVGHFKGARKSGMRTFKDVVRTATENADVKGKTVLTVCTGGIRCEKASAYLKSQGFTDVYQLHGGIHRYMERFPGQDFQGTLYTFDGRVTMDWGGDREVVGTCIHCGAPSETYADCLDDTCDAHFIACDACRNGTARAYCALHAPEHSGV
jgi:UPF0176 protein